jgi:hypothetical protein
MATLNLRRDASKTVKDSIRSTLADSYVAAVAVIVLLIWTFDLGFQALWEPIYRIGYTLVTSLLILEIPDFSISLGRID